MADPNGQQDSHRWVRDALLADLELLNGELARLRVGPVISNAAAALYPVEDLPALITATRRHLRHMAEELGGLG